MLQKAVEEFGVDLSKSFVVGDRYGDIELAHNAGTRSVFVLSGYGMINDGGRTYNVEVEVQAQEEVRTPLGVFQTFRLEPKVFDGLFKTKGRLFVWLTNDAARMPVQLKAKVNIGTITVALTQVNQGNLRPAGIPAKPSFE